MAITTLLFYILSYDLLVFFLDLIRLKKSFSLNKLNTLDNNRTQMMATIPPTTAEKKLLRNVRQIFETKCPKKLQGIIIRQYLTNVDVKFKDKSPSSALIFLIFK